MVAIGGIGPFKHLRAEPNEYVVYYREGERHREGRGLAFWFNPLVTSVSQVPGEDCETTFLLTERSRDLQEVTVQMTLRYRIADPARAVERFNFTISLEHGTWQERPLETLSSLWSEHCQEPVRRCLAGADLTEAIQTGAVQLRSAVEEALQGDASLAAMGLELVDVRVIRVAPGAEMEKALQTPTREALRQKADEAVFRRRAHAVEKERSIKENELATEIELERRHEDLIARRGQNRLLEVRHEAEAEQARTEAEVARRELEAEAEARTARTRAGSEAESLRLVGGARAESERLRVDLWRDAPARVVLGFALQELARKIEHIQHLNLSPSLFGRAFEQFLLKEVDEG